MIEIKKGDFEGFFQAPFNAYPQDAPYTSPLKSDLKRALDPAKNPLFKAGARFAYFTAYEGQTVLGRILVHEHAASNQKYKTNSAFFGFFDCADRPEIGAALLDRAENWARAHGFAELIGNFNLTAMQMMGVQTDHFDRHGFTDMMQNPAHIPAFLKAGGFEAFFPATTFELDLATANLPISRLTDDFHFAPIKRSTFKARMEEARLVLNDGFSENPMFVPLTPEEFTFQAGDMTAIIDPRLSSVLKHKGAPVGVVICIPDLNGFLKATKSRFSIMTVFHFLRFRCRRTRAVIIFYSVSKSMHGRGLMSGILARTLQQLKDAGYERLGITWIADENKASLRMVEKIGAEPLHRLHLFRKDLT